MAEKVLRKTYSYRLTVVIRSVRGLTQQQADEALLKMEIAANAKGDPRYHLSAIKLVSSKEV